jgi:hypothetical protein
MVVDFLSVSRSRCFAWIPSLFITISFILLSELLFLSAYFLSVPIAYPSDDSSILVGDADIASYDRRQHEVCFVSTIHFGGQTAYGL